MTTLSLNNRNDDLIELNRDSFSKSPLAFNIPSKQNRVNPSQFHNDDILFNKNKISSDVVSMSSRSSSRASSRASSIDGDRYEKKNFMKKMHVYKNKYKDGTDSDSSSMVSMKETNQRNNQDYSSNEASRPNRGHNNSIGSSSSSSDGSSSYETDDTSSSGGSDGSDGSNGSNGSDASENSQMIKRKHLDPQQRMMNELNEKREIIYQLDRLESKGYKVPFKFNMNSDLEEMRNEYHRIIREKELDASVRFQQKMLMAFVSGTEYLNNRYDPFAIKLDGWSEQINENINDYDDIFEELHYKYKSSGKKMAPEMRLFISLSGSAFMFHLTSRMFKEQPLPNVENVLKSDPELMKQFQNAAAKQYIMGNNGPMPSMQGAPRQQSSADGGMGLFNMVSNLFGSLGGPSGPSGPSQSFSMPSAPTARPVDDVDNIIKNVHSKISIDNMDHNNIETLSVSDEEITSIIEDTADIKILRGTKGKGNARTLNLA